MNRMSTLLLSALGLAMTASAEPDRIKYIPPTEQIRGEDPAGCGDYHCPRGERLHLALDYLAEPGAPVRSPIDGTIERFGFPYFDDLRYELVAIRHQNGCLAKLMYVSPRVEKGAAVQAGDIIGTAQDIRLRYPGHPQMSQHIHLQMSCDGKRVNPTKSALFSAASMDALN